MKPFLRANDQSPKKKPAYPEVRHSPPTVNLSQHPQPPETNFELLFPLSTSSIAYQSLPRSPPPWLSICAWVVYLLTVGDGNVLHSDCLWIEITCALAPPATPTASSDRIKSGVFPWSKRSLFRAGSSIRLIFQCKRSYGCVLVYYSSLPCAVVDQVLRVH